MHGTSSVLVWPLSLHSAQSVPGPGQSCGTKGDSEPSLAEHRAAVMNGDFLTLTVKEAVAPWSSESGTLVTATEPNVGSGPVDGSPGAWRQGSRRPSGYRWQHFGATSWATCRVPVSTSSSGGNEDRALLTNGELSETPQAPPGHGPRHSSEVNSLPAGENTLGWKGGRDHQY